MANEPEDSTVVQTDDDGSVMGYEVTFDDLNDPFDEDDSTAVVRNA